MPPPERSRRRTLTRADLPAELTPETVRRLGMRTLRQLSQRDNGVLDTEEQQRFDAALAAAGLVYARVRGVQSKE